MKVYRGPKGKPFSDDAHQFVSRIESNVLEKSIRDGALIEFNITKDGPERQAICTALFEDEDIIPMINGLTSKLKSRQMALLEIGKVIKNQELDETGKVEKIKAVIGKL